MAPITSIELTYYYSGLGTTIANSLSVGGTIGLNTIPDGASYSGNIFDDVTGDEAASGYTIHRGIYIKNTHSGADLHNLTNSKVWIDGFDRKTGNDTIDIATERPVGATPIIQTIAGETYAPVTGSFVTTWVTEDSSSIAANYCTLAGTVGIGTIGTGDYAGIWLRRRVPAGASAANARSCTIKVQGETSASPYISVITRTYIVTWGRSFEILESADKVS